MEIHLWLYALGSPTRLNTLSFTMLCELWVFADARLMPLLQNMVSDALIINLLGKVVEMEAIQMISPVPISTSTSAGVLGGDAAAEETTLSESGTGSSTGDEHLVSAEYAFGTAVGYERTTAASSLDGEAKGDEPTYQVPSVVEHARGYAFGGEIDSSTTPPEMASEFQKILAMLLNAFHRQSRRREM
ncbi:hypothetical protein LTS10_002422 [Elasticomyces elasticus]|nr:hypothetical protein LTS10_002422 [Elasticomyces elasticus]